MTQYSSEQIKAQIAELQKTQILMELLEKKFPRKKKNRLTFLPYDCVENIYDFMGDNEVAQYRLAKAVSKTHNDLTVRCYKATVYKLFTLKNDPYFNTWTTREKHDEVDKRYLKLKEKVIIMKNKKPEKIYEEEKKRIEMEEQREKDKLVDSGNFDEYHQSLSVKEYTAMKELKYQEPSVWSGEGENLKTETKIMSIDYNQPVYVKKENEIIDRLMIDDKGKTWGFIKRRLVCRDKWRPYIIHWDHIYYSCHKIKE